MYVNLSLSLPPVWRREWREEEEGKGLGRAEEGGVLGKKKTSCHCSNPHSLCTVIDSIAAAPKQSPNSAMPKTPGYLTRL